MPQRKIKLSNLLIYIGLSLLAISIFLSIRYALHLRHRPFPRPRQINVQLIESWMTIQHISRLYQVPEPEIFTALNLPPDTNSRTTIQSIANQTNQDPQQLLNQIRDSITNFHNTHQEPPPSR